MLTEAEIKRFMDEDFASEKKKQARTGRAYYEGKHDIGQYRMFYYNADGELKEDTFRSNIRISHPFFTELVDQVVQYALSGDEGFIRSDVPELQAEMDSRFNENEDFLAELSEALTGAVSDGWAYMYAHKVDEDMTEFQAAECAGVIEVRAKDTDTNTEHVIYWYVDRIEKGQKQIKRIQVWDEKQVGYFVQTDEGEIEKDKSEKLNPRPHTLYQEENAEGETEGPITYEDYGQIPFFRLDNNKKQRSDLWTIKDIIDDYDIHACSLSNNLIDFDTPLHVVRGYEGDNLDELQTNLKTKKVVGVGEEGGVEVRTVDIPYQARLAKLELDERNIYRFGMGLNTFGLKDTNATTNVAIRAAYSLLDLKCSKLTIRLKQFLRKLIAVALAEINEANNTDYQQKDVYFSFTHEVMTNATENAQIALTEAQTKQVQVGTILNVAAQIGSDAALKAICEIMELDFDEVKAQVEQMQAEQGTATARAALEGVVTEDEPAAENSAAAIP